jgi:hypothetical protein
VTDPALVPAHDADVPAFWQSLDLPGLLDVHVHFLPKAIMDRVWEHFAASGPLIGRDWPIVYTCPDERRVDHLRSMGVRRWTALPTRTSLGSQGSSTTALERGVDVFKIYVQVGDFDLADPQLGDWLRHVCWHNPAALFEVDAAA